MVRIATDGNCLFRAISDQIYGQETLNTHLILRYKAVEFMRENRDDFECFIEDSQTFEEYLDKMSKDGTWGG